MLRTYTRPMTEAERDAVAESLLRYTPPARSLASQDKEAIRLRIVYIVLSVIAAIVVALFLAEGDRRGIWLGGIVVTLILIDLAGKPAKRKEARYGEESRKQWATLFARRLVRNEIEVTEVVVSDVIEVEPLVYMDISPMFLFDIGGNQALFLSSEYFQEETEAAEEEKGVPYTTFEIIRYPDAPEQIVSVRPTGMPMPVSRTLYWSSYEAADLLSEGEVLASVSLASIENDRPNLFTTSKEQGETTEP